MNLNTGNSVVKLIIPKLSIAYTTTPSSAKTTVSPKMSSSDKKKEESVTYEYDISDDVQDKRINSTSVSPQKHNLLSTELDVSGPAKSLRSRSVAVKRTNPPLEKLNKVRKTPRPKTTKVGIKTKTSKNKRNKWKIKSLRLDEDDGDTGSLFVRTAVPNFKTSSAVPNKKGKKSNSSTSSGQNNSTSSVKSKPSMAFDAGNDNLNVFHTIDGRKLKLKMKRIESEDDELFDEIVIPHHLNPKTKKVRKTKIAEESPLSPTKFSDLDDFEFIQQLIKFPELDTKENDTRDIVFEVCVDNFQSVINAEVGGAKRLELSSSISEGGLTPSGGFLKFIKGYVSIPVFVMIRPRGGDFIYSAEEVEIMKMDIILLKELGADGFVFGILDKEKNVDERKCQVLLDVAYPLPCTFHRAFDFVTDSLEALSSIIKLGFSRLLTSGQQKTAVEGIPFIRKLVDSCGSSISIMAGAGVNPDNVAQIIRETGVTEIHCSASVKQPTLMNCTKQIVSMGKPISDDSSHFITDSTIVAEIVRNATIPIGADN